MIYELHLRKAVKKHKQFHLDELLLETANETRWVSRLDKLTGWATRHCFTCAKPANSLEGSRHELELLKTTWSSAILSS